MELLLIFIFAILNLCVVFIYYPKRLGVFQAPFIMGMISLNIFLPQLSSIYFSPYYDSDLLNMLVPIMIFGNIFFIIGFSIGNRKKVPIVLREVNLKKAQYHITFFGILGFSTIFLFGSLNELIDTVIASNLKNFSILAFSMALVSVINIRTKHVYFNLLIAIIPIINFAFFVKASRGDTLQMILNIGLCVSIIWPNYSRKIKIFIASFFILGTMMSASISQIRRIVKKDSNANFNEIGYFETFTSSFKDTSYPIVGMDLANAAQGIEFCYYNDSYDFGLQFWNGFVFNYIPGRVVGEKVKRDLYFEVEYFNLIPKLTHNVTTMTAYFDSFAILSFFGFIVFLIAGYIYGVIWSRFTYSNIYQFLYFFLLSMIVFMFTHGFQAPLSRLEFLVLIILPLFLPLIKKKKTII